MEKRERGREPEALEGPLLPEDEPKLRKEMIDLINGSDLPENTKTILIESNLPIIFNGFRNQPLAAKTICMLVRKSVTPYNPRNKSRHKSH